MNPGLVFVCFIAGMISVAFIVSRVTGARAQYLETFTLEPGEHVLWEDMALDAYTVAPRRASYTTARRSRRRAVRVTNRRILSGCIPLFGTKHMIEHVLYPSDRPFPEEANSLGGGLLTKGYATLVFERASVTKQGSPPQFMNLLLCPSLPSSINALAFRIHSDHSETFCLPD